MMTSRHFFVRAVMAVGILACTLAAPPALHAATLAADNAADPAYADGWQGTTTNNTSGVVETVGDNGGFGFEPWNFDTDWLFNPDPVEGHHSMDSTSAYNQLGTAWTMSKLDPSSLPRAGRGFAPLQIGQTLSVVFDNPVEQQFNQGFFIRFNSRNGVTTGGGNICYDYPGYSTACTACDPDGDDFPSPIGADPVPKLEVRQYQYTDFQNWGKWGALNAGEPWEDSFPIRRHDGEFRWHLSRAMPFRDDAGNVRFWFGTNTDITEERNRAETRQQLLEAERIARTEAERVSHMKDEFLATLSHELRTPLNAIYGWTQLLKMDSDDPETVREGIDIIDRNVRLQTQLIEDLLDMSRIISGKIRLDVQHVDLPELISSAIESVRPAADARQLRIERVVDPLAGPVSGDPARLQQVLWNLLSNAIKFTPRGGKIQVMLERVQSHVELSVADTGEGIDPQFLPHLFERFSQADASTTRKHGGLGLGLSIVKNLVELHGGAIQAKSDGLGHGATFVIQLPLRVTKTSTQETTHPTAPAAALAFNCHDKLTGLKVLVVDDEHDARQLINRFLIECGATAALAASSDEGQAMLAAFQPDVIISDIGMPDQDGYDFIRAVRNNGHRTPAVALTAFARAEDRIRSIQAGYQSHLPKPVEPAELVAVVASLAGRF